VDRLAKMELIVGAPRGHQVETGRGSEPGVRPRRHQLLGSERGEIVQTRRPAVAEGGESLVEPSLSIASFHRPALGIDRRELGLTTDDHSEPRPKGFGLLVTHVTHDLDVRPLVSPRPTARSPAVDVSGNRVE